MTGTLPDVYVKRTYSGVALETVENTRFFYSPVRVDDDAFYMRRALDAACDGPGVVEYVICERVDDEHDCHVADYSTDDFDAALDHLLACPPGHYMVAVRP